MIQSNVALKNQHKSKRDYLILDSKKWDFQIQIILIQIKCFEQLAHGVGICQPHQKTCRPVLWTNCLEKHRMCISVCKQEWNFYSRKLDGSKESRLVLSLFIYFIMFFHNLLLKVIILGVLSSFISVKLLLGPGNMVTQFQRTHQTGKK